MAKVSLLKIAPTKIVEDKIITINGQEISVKQYLPIADKAEILNALMAEVFDDNYIASPIRLQIYFYLAIIKKYTNINLTDKQQENAAHTYDLLEVNDVFNQVIAAIPEAEFNDLFDMVTESTEKVAEFYHSLLGILKVSGQDYKDTAADVDSMMETIRNPEELTLVKDILDKMK